MNARMAETALVGEMITLRIPREVVASLVTVPPLPETVTQDSAFALFGIKPKGYLAFARAGRFPNQKRGRLRVALYSDVKAFLTTRERRPGPEAAKRDMSRGDTVDGEILRLAARRMR